ncbi:MAG: hypothetical protein AAB869_01220, partial [Patescibacteria group bacterium]
FDWTATRLTAAALALFAVSVVAQNLVLLLTRAFYAMGKTRLPLVANVTGAVTIVFSAFLLLFVFESSLLFRYFSESLLRVADISGTSILMLPLAYSIGMLVNVALLLFFLAREFIHVFYRIRKVFLHSFTASIVVGFIAYHGLQIFANVFNLDTFIGVFLQGFLAGLFGITAGLFLLHLMDNKELSEIRASLHKKFWKTRPIVVEREGI